MTDAHAQPTDDDIERFVAAARNKNMGVLRELLEIFGQNIIDRRDTMDDTALTWAAWNGDLEMATLLLDSGADIEMRERAKRTPLLCAVFTNKPDLVKLLLERGANVHALDGERLSARLFAQSMEMHEILTLLDEHNKVLQQRAFDQQHPELNSARLDKLRGATPVLRPQKRPPPP